VLWRKLTIYIDNTRDMYLLRTKRVYVRGYHSNAKTMLKTQRVQQEDHAKFQLRSASLTPGFCASYCLAMS
jgi:hypothetical protein